MGSTCQLHHPASNRICFKFQTEEGCKNKSCPYTHEVIGKEATQTILNWASQKSQENKEKGKGGGKGRDNQKHKPCTHFNSKKTPGQCRWGDDCRYSHAIGEDLRRALNEHADR